jgi:hypothetical protein
LHVESLEARRLLSTAATLDLSFLGANLPGNTLDHAAVIGDLSTVPSVRVNAAIGDSPAGTADVDWYAFTLDHAATVTLAASSTTGVAPPVLSLYVRDPFDPADPATIFGFRMLAQVEGNDPALGTLLTRELAPGSYYLAASGAGNTLFSPLLADSGYAGQTGGYQLQLTASDLGLGPADGPVVLTPNPAAGSTLDRSPTVIRLDLSAPIDPTTVMPDDDAWLTYNPAGTFGDGNDQDVPISGVNFSDATTELQITPAAPLAPGYYRLQLAGDTNANFDVVTGPDGTPLGTDDLHPSGQDFTLTFQVDGIEGNTGASAAADDTPAGAHDLGDVSSGRLVQVAGTIGDDPTDPVPFNPSDVDLYHFRISGPGRYAFAAEVFAQRIGSPLNAAASLFVLDPADGRLHLVAGNDDTQNPTRASDGRSLPLFADPALFAGLTAGDYYLAVSSHNNVPDPGRNLLPGTGGIFDPNVSHSGTGGRTTGDYVLNLRVWSDGAASQVVAVTPKPGDTLSAPPTSLTVQFDNPVNLQQLAFAAYQRTQQGAMSAVYVQGADGTQYYPRLQSYDLATGQATLLMLDRLPPGQYALHLSGPLGLADFAGNPLVGNDPGGDYVTHFTVAGTGVGAHTDQGPQDLGVLFPHELQSPGFAITSDTAGAYRFQVLQPQIYLFVLGGPSLPAGVHLTLTDGSGANVVTKVQADEVSLQAFLQPGAYTVQVSASDPAGGAYTVRVILGGSTENPQPLTVGPAPVLRLQLASAPPPASGSPPPVPAPAGGGQPAPAPAPTPAPDGPPSAPPAVVPAGGGQTATAAVFGPTVVIPAVMGPAPRGSVEAPSGLLAALGSGPVGGVGGSAGSTVVRAPLFSLTGPDEVAPPGPVRPTSAAESKSSGATPAARDAGAQDAASGGRGLLQITLAAAARLIDLPAEWERLFDEPGASGYDEDTLRGPDEASPREESERAAEPEAARIAEPVAATADSVAAVFLAAAAAGLACQNLTRPPHPSFSRRTERCG